MTMHFSAKPWSSAMDPELPRLAASAALEADLALLDPSAHGDFTALGTLIDKLRSSGVLDAAEHGPTGLVDPLSVDLFHRALVASNTECARTLRELRSVSEQIAGRKSVDSGSMESMLTDIRQFCIALSNHAAAMRGNHFGGNRRSSPYRT